MSARARLIGCLLVVCLLYGFHVRLKTGKIFAHETWDWHDDTGQFWSEFAVHYRFAKFFAEHPIRDWGELSRDRAVQFPDTINDWSEFTVAMEVPVGLLYRWVQPAIPFHVWVVWYDCLVSSLTLFGLFFLARALWRSDLAGLVASAFYASLYPSYGRTVKNLFLREDFAVPLIVFAAFFTVQAWQKATLRVTAAPPRAGTQAAPQIVAALFWLAALASWHLTQFVLAVGIVATVLVYLGRGETPRLPWFVWLMLVGAVAIPVLREKQFYLSPTMCALYALSLAVWINGGRKKAIKVFSVVFMLLASAGLLLGKSYGEYAHVYQLFFYKLRYLGEKPADPSQLPWEARCLWESAFNTAAACDWWRSLWWCGPLALAALARRMTDDGGRRKGNTAAMVFAGFTLLLTPLAWMVVRYFTFLGWAVAALAARTRWLAVPFVVWQMASLDSKPMDRAPVVPAEYKRVVQWIQENTATNTVILSSISESPVWLAYTGRPIILHSKFENRRIRERYREFLEAAYGDEERFYAFCKSHGADVFVWDAGFLSAGRMYKTGKMGEPDPNCFAVLCKRQPDRLRHFRLELTTERFVIFRVAEKGDNS